MLRQRTEGAVLRQWTGSEMRRITEVKLQIILKVNIKLVSTYCNIKCKKL